MTTQVRETQFGYLMRFLSRRRIFQYPDEVNHSHWKAILGREANDRLDILEEKDEAFEEQDTSSAGRVKDADVQEPSAVDLGAGHEAEEGKNVLIVGWDGPEDPENPRNWSSRWKLLVTFQICLLNFSVYMCSSIYVPGEESIMEEFGVSQVVATLGLSCFSIGYGLGPMLWSPMSEIPRFGRGGIYFWTLLTFVLLQLPTGFAVDMPMFLVFRVLTGFFSSPALATGGATISDMYGAASVTYAIPIWGSFGVLGPVFGPVVGGFVAPAQGWRWTIWVVTWLNALVLVMLFFLLPETSEAKVLYERSKRLRRATGDERFRSQSEIDAANFTMRDHLFVLGRAFTLTFFEPVVFFLDLYTALLYGVLFTWFESFPLVFGDIYGFDSGEQGLVFLGILIGSIITLPIFLLWLKYGLVPKLTAPGFKPETVLLPTFFGSASLPICLFFYGWSARASVPWIVPVIGSAFFPIGIITLFNPVLTYLGMAYPAYAASIFAGNALFRASFGAIFPLFARQLFTTLGVGPGNSLLGGISVCFMALPVIFYKYGEKMRRMSKNARHDD